MRNPPLGPNPIHWESICMQNAELSLLSALLRDQGQGTYRKGSDR